MTFKLDCHRGSDHNFKGFWYTSSTVVRYLSYITIRQQLTDKKKHVSQKANKKTYFPGCRDSYVAEGKLNVAL